jgi:threonine/homoserine/homoserine lactone efflux protein
MTAELLIALAGFAFVSSITPGPNNLMLMASGINFGMSRTIPHMLGVALGFAFMIFLVGIGLMQVFAAFPVLYSILKVVSVAYLSYLAWKIATAVPLKEDNQDAGDVHVTGKPMTFFQAALFQWVNPKAWVMGVTAISTYTTATDSVFAILLVVSIILVVSLPSIGTWTFLGTQMKALLNNPVKRKIFNITAALLLMASLYPIIFSSNF